MIPLALAVKESIEYALVVGRQDGKWAPFLKVQGCGSLFGIAMYMTQHPELSEDGQGLVCILRRPAVKLKPRKKRAHVWTKDWVPFLLDREPAPVLTYWNNNIGPGDLVGVDWRPTETVPEDYYAL